MARRKNKKGARKRKGISLTDVLGVTIPQAAFYAKGGGGYIAPSSDPNVAWQMKQQVYGQKWLWAGLDANNKFDFKGPALNYGSMVLCKIGKKVARKFGYTHIIPGYLRI